MLPGNTSPVGACAALERLIYLDKDARHVRFDPRGGVDVDDGGRTHWLDHALLPA
jgi:hypothetical protein